MNEVAAEEQEFESRVEKDPAFVEDLDVKLERKHKLLYTFTRALLEKLASDDPFMDIEERVHQCSEALDVYVATMRECPLLLAYVLPPGKILKGRGTEPLCSWLIPRVLVLLGRKGCERLTANIKALFGLIFQIIPQYPKLWCWESVLFSYLKGCIQCKFCSPAFGIPAHLERYNYTT